MFLILLWSKYSFLFIIKSGQKLLYNPKRQKQIDNYCKKILYSTWVCTALIIGHCFVDCSQERQSCNRGNCWQDGCCVEAIWEATTTMIFATLHHMHGAYSFFSFLRAGWWFKYFLGIETNPPQLHTRKDKNITSSTQQVYIKTCECKSVWWKIIALFITFVKLFVK